MKIISVTTSYNLKWVFKEYPEYRITECRKVINLKTNRIIKESINGGYTNGYWIGKKFIPKSKINKLVIKQSDYYCPF